MAVQDAAPREERRRRHHRRLAGQVRHRRDLAAARRCVECTGVGQVIADSIQAVAAGGVVCLTGVGSGGRTVGLSTADVAAAMVLGNTVVVGSVNANTRHWDKAGGALARAWLARLVTRRERPEDFARALDRRPDDIKVVVQFAEA